MNLRQWTGNSPALNHQAPDEGVYAKTNGQSTRTQLEQKDRYSVTIINKTYQGNQQHRQNLQKISTKLILKAIRPLGICQTSDSKSKNNDAGTMETQPNMGQRTS